MEATIALFARPPVPGRCKTRLARTVGADRAAQLYRAMLLDSFTALRSVRADRYLVLATPEDGGIAALESLAPPPWEVARQEGDSLGERMANAVRLGTGEHLTVLVGSDSPTLPLAPLAAALDSGPGKNRILVGPCDDGGYYLIGLTVAELPVLQGIPWSTPRVLRATRQRCRRLGLSLAELPTWYDVDDADGLRRLERELAAAPERAPRSAEVLAGWTGLE